MVLLPVIALKLALLELFAKLIPALKNQVCIFKTNVWFMLFGQGIKCQIGVECQVFVIVIFFFKCDRVLQF